VVLDVTREQDVLVLTLNRPEALNAFTVELHEQLAAALKAAAKPDVRAVVVTGAGRGFCVGQDLDEVQEQPTGAGERLRRFYNPNVLALRALEKPVFAAINGPTAGAGIGLALACDVRVAARRASFVPAFVAIGLVPDSAASFFTVELLGYAHAFEWMTSNRKLDAEEALALGLVAEVVDDEALLERTLERAARLASAPGEAVGMTKRLMAHATHARLEQQLELERQLQDAATRHPAYAEQVAAFLAKRSR